MQVPSNVAIQRYNLVRDEVKSKSPEMWDLVIKLCKAAPDQVLAENVWQFGRDKPCWSNIKVNIGERIAADISRSNAFNSFETIAGDEWKIVMKSTGTRWKANNNFELVGSAVQEFVSGVPKGGIASYLWKLYAIRNLAIALRDDSVIRKMVADLSVQGRIPATDLKKWTQQFADRAGMGWGVVTVYHMLTDLGLTAKPDLHLKKSAIRMGLLTPKIPANYPEELFENVSDHDIVLAVMSLSELIVATACPEKPNTSLREADKILMEWSRQGLARAF